MSDYFDRFVSNYPSPEKRYESALELASNMEVTKDVDHLSRRFLTAHWGDTDNELRPTADYLYDLKSIIDTYVNQPFIVIRNGNFEDIVSDENWLNRRVELFLGKVAAPELIYGFRGNPQKKGNPRMGVSPPFLGFGAQIPFSNPRWLELDVDRNANTEPDEKTKKLLGSGAVATYFGTVSLEDDIESYHRNRTTLKRTVLFGDACLTSLEGLLAKTNHETQDQVQSIIDSVEMELAA